MATVHVSGAQCFRQRIVSSILSGRPVKIDRIRADDEEPGLRGAPSAPPASLAPPPGFVAAKGRNGRP